jgi:hypothetical protein
MQDSRDEALKLGTDQMQLQCIKTGDYIIEKYENVGVSGQANNEVDMKLFKVICKPVGEAKILSTKRSEELEYFLDVNGTETMKAIEFAFEGASKTGKWHVFHPNKIFLDNANLIWGMVLKCNMELGTSEFHPWEYGELLQAFAPHLDWSVLLNNNSAIGEQRLCQRKGV